MYLAHMRFVCIALPCRVSMNKANLSPPSVCLCTRTCTPCGCSDSRDACSSPRQQGRRSYCHIAYQGRRSWEKKKCEPLAFY